jgi:hypothetical protein
MSIALILKNQNPLKYLPGSLTDFLLTLPDLPSVLTSCEQWLASPTFLQPMASSLCSRVLVDVAYDTLSTLFTFKSLSSDGVVALCLAIFRNWANVGEEEQIKLLPLLRRSYQVFPELLRRAANEVEAEAAEMEGEEIQRLVESIAMVILSSMLSPDLTVALFSHLVTRNSYCTETQQFLPPVPIRYYAPGVLALSSQTKITATLLILTTQQMSVHSCYQRWKIHTSKSSNPFIRTLKHSLPRLGALLYSRRWNCCWDMAIAGICQLMCCHYTSTYSM